jgi:glutamine synthetase
MTQTLRSYPNFGRLVFTRPKMAQYLSKAANQELLDVLDAGRRLTRDLADQVAHAMKEWALDHGATHFTHWFQPMRGVTAEKHDAFLGFDHGVPLDRFSGAQLIQSEPDASSFPSGGMRSTFEARGYTAWDPSSPVFLAKGAAKYTLVIPSVYLSYTGEVLDMRTQVLRSTAVVTMWARQVLHKLGQRRVGSVQVTVGPEQEYFLISKKYFERRPDLLLAGRTLLGGPSAKHQQFEDHYFGAIRPQVLAFMEEVDEELAERGIPFKTRHNEVAPHQYEIAPTFVEGTLAVDQNLQLMDLMQRVADRHGFAVLFGEKPFAGVNGSGKHLNWSLMDDAGVNLFEPGDAPKRNLPFLVFVSAMLLGVDRFSGLLRAAVADAGNDHRLGANEAPPAVMSVYIGGYLGDLLDAFEKQLDIAELEKTELDMKVKHLPGVDLDTTDRNRTSPVAFTGNKFEFRAVGADQNIAEALTVLNLLMSYGLERMAEKIDRHRRTHAKTRDAALAAVSEALRETRRIRFDGNNYCPEWHEEAARRGLPAAKNTPAALATYLEPDVLALYEKFCVLSAKEVEAKVEVRREMYKKTKLLELNVLQEISRTMILPALVEQVRRYAEAERVLSGGRGKDVLQGKVGYLSELLGRLEEGIHRTGQIYREGDDAASLETAVHFLGEDGAAVLEELRTICDEVEREIDADLWKLPRYWEMLHLF